MAYNWGKGYFFGQIAKEWGIEGQVVTDEQFEHIVHGRHPVTGQQLIKLVEPYETTNKYGEKVMTIGHRVGVDMVVRPPKWYSILAYMSGDEKLKRELWRDHIAAANEAAKMAEEYACVRLNGGKWGQSGKIIAMAFHHERARPDDEKKHAAPLIHTHFLIANMTKDPDDPTGKIRSLQENPFYGIQGYLTAAYRALLSEKAQNRGIKLEVGKDGVPHAVGIPREYVEAASPRSAQVMRQAAEIVDRMRKKGVDLEVSHGVRKLAAKWGRESKNFDEKEAEQMDAALEQRFQQAAHKLAVEMAAEGPIVRSQEEIERRAKEAVNFAIGHLSESEAVYNRHEVFRQALNINMTQTTLKAVKTEILNRETTGELVPIAREEQMGLPERTTRRMIELETSNISRLMEGRTSHRPLAEGEAAETTIIEISQQQNITLNRDQHQAILGLLRSQAQVIALQGKAGSGKTTALRGLARAAERGGFDVIGLGPTGIASKQLEPAQVKHQTLDSFLESKHSDKEPPRYFILDEASLTGTVKLHDFLQHLRPQDRLLMVGDRNQHEAIQAGAPFRQAQDAGVPTLWISEIVRQREKGYRKVSSLLQAGKIAEAIDELMKQGRIIEVKDTDSERPESRGDARYSMVAKLFLKNPKENLAICPDNLGRATINRLAHEGLQKAGIISDIDHEMKVLVNGRSMSIEERKQASKYEGGDVLRYQKGSRLPGMEIREGSYGRVISTSLASDAVNALTVRLDDGRTVTYDPRRLYGVEVFKEDTRKFSEGDTIQYRRPHDERGPYGRRSRMAVTSELGTVEKIEGSIFTVRKHDGRLVKFDTRTFKHVDHGYATTSFLSQSLTAADGVIIHIDTRTSRILVNMRMLKVAATRGVDDIRIVTNSRDDLLDAVSRKQDKTIALHAVEDTRMWEVKREAERAEAFASAMQLDDEAQQFSFDDLAPIAGSSPAAQQSIGSPHLKQAAPVEPRSFKRQVEKQEYERQEPRQKYGKRDWTRATRSRPCPVCDGDGCSITHDRKVVRCWRVQSAFQNKAGAWVHRLDDETRTRIPVVKRIEVNQYDLAPIEKRHEIYDALLNSPALGLTMRDEKDLLARGLDKAAIKRNGYRSVPKPGYLEEVMKKMGDRDYRGVPGFFTVTDSLLYKMPGFYGRGVGSWSLNIGAWMNRDMKVQANSDGYFVWVRNESEEIEGAKVKRMAGNKPKYLWLSSAERENGASPSTPLHFNNAEKAKETGQVIVVEGPLKADVVAHHLDYQYAVIGVGGVNSFGERFGQEIKRRLPGVKQVIVAYDMDSETNDKVQMALNRVHANLRSAGLDGRDLKWEWSAEKGTDKGLDDYLHSSDAHKEHVRQFMRDAAQSVGPPRQAVEQRQKTPLRGYRM